MVTAIPTEMANNNLALQSITDETLIDKKGIAIATMLSL